MQGNNNGLGGTGGPTPLVQLRIGFVMTDLSEPGAVCPSTNAATRMVGVCFGTE